MAHALRLDGITLVFKDGDLASNMYLTLCESAQQVEYNYPTDEFGKVDYTQDVVKTLKPLKISLEQWTT